MLTAGLSAAQVPEGARRLVLRAQPTAALPTRGGLRMVAGDDRAPAGILRGLARWDSPTGVRSKHADPMVSEAPRREGARGVDRRPASRRLGDAQHIRRADHCARL